MFSVSGQASPLRAAGPFRSGPWVSERRVRSALAHDVRAAGPFRSGPWRQSGGSVPLWPMASERQVRSALAHDVRAAGPCRSGPWVSERCQAAVGDVGLLPLQVQRDAADDLVVVKALLGH